MKVFISSVIGGFEEHRAVAEDAVRTLGHEVIKAEDFGASSNSPRIACLEGLRQSDLVILILGDRYGDVQPVSGVSATHEEFREAKDSKEVLAFVGRGEAIEALQRDFIREVQDWNGGLFTENFKNLDELRRAITRTLHGRLIEEAKGPSNTREVVERCLQLLPGEERHWSSGPPSLVLGLSTNPRQTILRPVQIEGADLADVLFKIAMHGRNSILDRGEGTKAEISGNALTLRQDSHWLTIHGDGSLVGAMPVESGEMQMTLIEEDVHEKIARMVKVFDEVLSEIDQTGRVRNICLAADVLGSNHLGWRTREEEGRSPHTVQISHSDGEIGPVTMDPPVRPRASIRTQKDEIAEDLMVLLRRRYR